MSAGGRNSSIIIEQCTSTPNALGEAVTTWSTFSAMRAQVIPINGKERFSAGQERNEVTHRIKIRYLSGVTPKMRINLSGRYFDIQSVINFQERGRDLEIMAIENV